MSTAPKQAIARAWHGLAHFLGEHPVFPAAVDFTLLDALARRHRFDSPLVDPKLAPVSPATVLPQAVWARWQQTHAAALAQSIRRLHALGEALQALAPLPAIVLKGAAFAELLYPNPADRLMGDLDLLVRAEDLPEALARLAPLGYARLYPGHPILDDPAFHERQLRGPRFELDLHQAFIQPARLPIDYAGIFARALPWPALGGNARLLAPADAVVYGCLHAAIGEFTPTWAPAIGLLDLRQMLRARGPLWRGHGPPLDLAEVATRAREFGAERMLAVALALASALFPSLTPVRKKLAPALSPGVAALLNCTVAARAHPPALGEPSRAEVLWRKALLLRPAARLRLAAHHLPRRLKPR